MTGRWIAPLALLCAAAGCSDKQQNAPPESVSTEGSPLTRLQADTHVQWEITSSQGRPIHLVRANGSRLTGTAVPLAKGIVAADEAAYAFLSRYGDLFGITDARKELTVVRQRSGISGQTHVRMQQHVGGVPVRGGEVIAHYDPSGELASVTNAFVAGASQIDLNPKWTAAQAQAAALAHFKDFAPSFEPSQFMREPASELVIASAAGRVALAYHLRLFVDFPNLAIMDYLVDAQSGEILTVYNDVQTTGATGSGVGVFGETRVRQIDRADLDAGGGGDADDAASTGDAGAPSSFVLLDNTRADGGIQTHAVDHAPLTNGTPPYDKLPGTVVSSTDPTKWDEADPVGKGAAVDAHYFAGAVYDFYREHFNRNSYDDKGSRITSSVHLGALDAGYDNAAWLTVPSGAGLSSQMIYGDGQGKYPQQPWGDQVFKASLAGAIDVIGHEITHGVTSVESQLTYSGQPGALNESMSDIFGAFIEHFNKPDDVNNWLIGEAVTMSPHALRDMVHPGNGWPTPQPGHMGEYKNLPEVPKSDNGGVHSNSGIPNNAAYLMTLGGRSDYSKVLVGSGIGWDNAMKVWYDANTNRLASSSDFAAAAKATEDAAAALQLSEADRNIVECAWIAVGVLSGVCKDTTGGTSGPAPDAGVGPVLDAGPADAAADAKADAADASDGAPTLDATVDTGAPDTGAVAPPGATSSTSSGCGCKTAGTQAPAGAGWAALLAAAALFGVRRRRAA